MVIDSSAIFAIVLQEPEREAFLDAILNSNDAVIGAPTLFECRVVALRRGSDILVAQLQGVLDRLAMRVEAFEQQHERIAAEAYRRYGKGIDRAGLNFGDCFSYALARAKREPMLYKGDDFAQTDVVSAVAAG